MQTLYVQNFSSPGATLEETGGKGVNLCRMARAGFPVPPGFVITTAAYKRFVAENDLQGRILATLRQPADAASEQIRALFVAAPVPADIAEAARAAYAASGAPDLSVAVRSSATAEDLPGASFAGQQDTYLNVRGDEALLDAVRRCWASLWTERAIAYRARQGIAPESVSLAVVGQQMVFADAAGIMFTANPVSGARDEVVINAAWGLGEAIVSGLVTPDNVIAGKAGGRIKQQTIADKAVMTARTPTGVEERPVKAERRRMPALSEAQVARLVELAVAIEAHYGEPQDIEWALTSGTSPEESGEIQIVQARPITALPPAPLRWITPTADRWLHGGGTLELLTEPVSPLGGSLMLTVMRDEFYAWLTRAGMDSIFSQPFMAVVNGFAYFNTTVHLSLKPLWRWYQFYQEHMHSMAGWPDALREYREATARLAAEPPERLSGAALCERVVALSQVGMRYWIYMTKIVQPIFHLEQGFIKFYKRSVRRAGDPEPEVFMRGQETRPLAAERSVYALAELARTLPGVPDLLAGAEPLSACAGSEAGRRFLAALDAHLAEFGHQIYSFDPQLPTLADDPLPVLLAVRSHLDGQEGPDARQARMAQERAEALAHIEGRLGAGKLRRFRALLSEAQRAAKMREDALFEVGLAWTPLYRALLALGTRLVSADALAGATDVFWLHMDEVRAAALGLDAGIAPESLKETARAREKEQERFKQARPPYLLPEGTRPQFWWKFAFPQPDLQKHEEGALVGLGVSPGSVTAVARVVASPAEMERVNQGEILVAHATTPAWTPLFARIAALVTDMGGPLAHGSIVAREYGIPAVMGVGVATQQIRDGQTVTVDGTSGRVYLSEV